MRDKSESILPKSQNQAGHNSKYCHHQTFFGTERCHHKLPGHTIFLEMKRTINGNVSFINDLKQCPVWTPGVATYKPACRQMMTANNQFCSALPSPLLSSVFWASQISYDPWCDVNVLHEDEDDHRASGMVCEWFAGKEQLSSVFQTPSTSTLLSPLRKMSIIIVVWLRQELFNLPCTTTCLQQTNKSV